MQTQLQVKKFRKWRSPREIGERHLIINFPSVWFCHSFALSVQNVLELLRTAEKHNCEKVAFQYGNTGKNQYLTDFLNNNGACFNNAGIPEILLSKYRYHETFITLRNAQNGK